MTKNQHGGKRIGAGRKKHFDEPVTRLRVPCSAVPTINYLLKQIKDLPTHNIDNLEIRTAADNPIALARPLFSRPFPPDSLHPLMITLKGNWI